MDEEEARQRRIALRLEVVDGLLWAIDNAGVVLDLSEAALNRDAAVQALQERYGLTEFVAHHVLDITFGQVTGRSVENLREEAQRLRRGEDTATRGGDMEQRLNESTLTIKAVGVETEDEDKGD